MTSAPPPDRQAEFARLYMQCADWLYCYLLSLLRRPEDAEEVLQETASLMCAKFDQYQPGTEFRAWGCRIAHFLALKFRERQKRAPLTFSDLFFDAVDQEIVVMAEKLDYRAQALGHCVEQLTPEDRKLIEVRYVSGATARDTARQMGQSLDSVYRALKRVRDRLQRCVSRTLRLEREA